MTDSIAIKVENVSKTFRLPHDKNTSIKGAVLNFYRSKHTYEKQQVLQDVSFEVKQGEFFGIVGRNGSGKSTLLKMLAGIYTPSHGNITINGKLTPFIELGVGFSPELTGRENVFLNGALLGFSRKEMEALYDDIVDFAELHRFMDQKLKNYSSGMQVRLAFSIAIRAESDILILDEVLAVGDSNFQRKCYEVFDTIKKSGRTIIFVTHDMSAVQQYCDRAIMLKEGHIADQGKPREIALLYEIENLERANEESANQNSSETKKKRPANPSLKIESITLTDSGDNATQKNSYSLKDPIKVHVTYTSKSAKDVAIGINITRTDGKYMAGYSTKEDVGVIRAKKGTNEVVCTIEAGQLAQGHYNLNAAVFTYDDFKVIDFLDIAMGIKTPLFHIIEADRSKDGLFNLRGKWEVK